MMSVLKTVGKGILYILGLPFFLIILVGTGIAGIFVLIFMFFKSIILFFTGRSLDDALPEDKKAKQIKEGRTAPAAGPILEQPVYTNNTYTQQVPPEPTPQPTTIEEAVFGQPEEKIPFEDEIQPAPAAQPERSTDEIFESILGTEQKEEKYTNVNVQPENNDDEPIGQYIPHKSNQRIVEDTEEEEEDNSATNIYFGGDND